MKKLVFLIFVVGGIFFCSCEGIYDKIGDHATEEIVYPGRLDTIVGKVGFERVELDFFYPPNRIPASQMKLGKAKYTVVEYDGKTLQFDSVCSWVSVPNLTQAKLYRIKVYTTDENGYKSVPQEIAIKPFVSSDFSYLVMAAPKITSSSWAADLKWSEPSSVLLDYVDLTYKYKDKDGVGVSGVCEEGVLPVVQLTNLEPEQTYSVDVKYRIIPKADNEVILDTTYLENTYSVVTPSSEEYQRKLEVRGMAQAATSAPLLYFNCNYNWLSGDLTINWANVTDGYMQYTTVIYMDGDVEKEITVQNGDTQSVIPGFNLGTTLKIRSNYEVVGVPDTYIDTFDKIFDPFIDLNRTLWKCIYTSIQPATDGYPSGTDPSPGTHNAQIDGDPRSFLSMAKPGKSVNGSVNNGAYQMPMSFVIDMQQSYRFNYLRVCHRTTDTGDGLRVRAVKILGSDTFNGPVGQYTNPTALSSNEDQTNWTTIATLITFPEPRTVLSPNMPIPLSNYRYIKIEYTGYDAVNNSAAQMAEFYLGIMSSSY